MLLQGFPWPLLPTTVSGLQSFPTPIVSLTAIIDSFNSSGLPDVLILSTLLGFLILKTNKDQILFLSSVSLLLPMS